ncbi:MAG: hypothetical protein AAGF28_10075 [Pseudomonadota bacterium]
MTNTVHTSATASTNSTIANSTKAPTKRSAAANKKATSKKEQLKQAAGAAAETVTSKTREAVSSATQMAENTADESVRLAADQAQQIARDGQQRTEHVMQAVSRAFAAGSESLERDGMNVSASYVRATADGLQRAATEVDRFDTGRLTGKLEDFVRERPLMTMGALAIAGFALAGSLKRSERS